MSEAAEKISPAGAPPELPKSSHRREVSVSLGESPEHSNRAHRELLFLATSGATIGFLTGWGLWNEIHFHSVEFVLLAIPAALGAYVLYDPIADRIRGKHEEKRAEDPERRGTAAFIAGTAAALFVAMSHGSLDAALNFKELAGRLDNVSSEPLRLLFSDLAGKAEQLGEFGMVLVAFLSIGVASLLVTHFWVRGVRRQPPRPARHAGTIALLFGFMGFVALVGYLVSHGVFRYWPSRVLAGLALFWFFVPALSGGLAIQRHKGKSIITRGIVLYSLISSALYLTAFLIAAWAFGAAFRDFKETIYSWIWLPIAALVAQNLGWALAPHFRGGSCSGPLCPPCTAIDEDELVRESTAGQIHVVPRHGPSSSATAGMSVADDGRRPAQNTLFKPTGDRRWATVALVLALVSCGLAYRLGTIRSDRDIDHNLQTLLHQDSGLDTKGLLVTSAHRVITIAGVVDNEVEHQKAIQEASSVRGVKQIVDQIKVAPPVPPVSLSDFSTQPAGVVVPLTQPAPTMNVTIPIAAPQGGGVAAQKSPKTTAAAPKKESFLQNLKKNAQPVASGAQKQAANAQKQTPAAQKQTSAPPAADDQKHKGFFHFLKRDKKDKDKSQNNSGQPK